MHTLIVSRGHPLTFLSDDWFIGKDRVLLSLCSNRRSRLMITLGVRYSAEESVENWPLRPEHDKLTWLTWTAFTVTVGGQAFWGGKKRREWVKIIKKIKESAHKVYRVMTQQQKRVKETRSLVQNNIKEVVLSAGNRKLSVSCYYILNDLRSPGQSFSFSSSAATGTDVESEKPLMQLCADRGREADLACCGEGYSPPLVDLIWQNSAQHLLERPAETSRSNVTLAQPPVGMNIL